MKVTTAAIALAIATLHAQSPADEVSRLEQQGKRVYASSYRGITAMGQYETAAEGRTRGDSPRRQDVRAEIHGNTAIVTGVETADGAADRVLRIWMKDGDRWQIVAAQTTLIGSRTDVIHQGRCRPRRRRRSASAAEVAIWRSQEALMRSFAEADPDSYRRFSTVSSLRMMTNGDAIPREQWIDTIAKRSKGPLAVVDEIRIAVYGDVGLVTLRGHEANPTRQSWVYLLENGIWKLHLRFTTAIRN
jgi:ketosteroid isomerase-like protein